MLKRFPFPQDTPSGERESALERRAGTRKRLHTHKVVGQGGGRPSHLVVVQEANIERTRLVREDDIAVAHSGVTWQRQRLRARGVVHTHTRASLRTITGDLTSRRANHPLHVAAKVVPRRAEDVEPKGPASRPAFEWILRPTCGRGMGSREGLQWSTHRPAHALPGQSVLQPVPWQ